VVNLIGATTTTAGLRIRSGLDKAQYEMGVAVTDAELAHVNLRPARTRGAWNYRIDPNESRSTDK
jgi:hypothetical protein